MIDFIFIELGNIFIFYFLFFSDLGINLVFLIFALSLLVKFLFFYPENKIKKITDIRSLHFNKIKSEVLNETFLLKGEAKFNATNIIYKKYKYNPIHELILVMPYLVQVPIFLTMYYLFISINEDIFSNINFLFIDDLSKPDAMIANKFITINILPITMTIINLISITIYNTSSKVLEFSIPFLFLLLLYNKPSALVLYWTFNNILYLITILYQKYL